MNLPTFVSGGLKVFWRGVRTLGPIEGCQRGTFRDAEIRVSQKGEVSLRTLRNVSRAQGDRGRSHLPRNHGGSDDLSNLQALCYSCNAMKRDRDDTDFRQISASYAQRHKGCLFCEMVADRIIEEDELSFAIRDAHPVTDLHTLVIPKRHVPDYFGLYQPERNSADRLLNSLRSQNCKIDSSVTGFNIGMNNGADAGQTVFHCHIHLIPRRKGDVAEPRGGVRGVVPDKQTY